MKKSNALEKLLWSIAFPGFGQLLNGKFFKGLLLISLEFLINVKSHLNVVIISSFRGEISLAIEQTDYQWLMFYPCVYLFSSWDAFRDAGGGSTPFSFLPFVFSAYVGTIGVIYSPVCSVFGFLPGPVWLPIAALIIGAWTGALIQRFILKYINEAA